MIRQIFSDRRILQPLTFGALVAMTVVAGMSLGLDIPWDYYSYHAYSASQLFHDRLDRDYFAAGQQGYMNPIGFVPLAIAQELKLTGRQIGAMLSALHALNYVAVLLLCRDLTRLRSDRLPYLVFGGLIALASPILLTHLGSTFTDPIASALVLFAAWLLITKRSRPAHFSAGFLLAVAVAIKPTNAVFVLALGTSTAWPWQETRSSWLSRCGALAIGGFTGALIAQGFWSWRLYKLTGNPFFPFLNNIFHSPWLPHDAPLVGRFVPDSFFAALQRPLLLARFESWGVLELPSPTMVPLAAACALAMYVASRCWSRSHADTPEQTLARTSPEAVKLVLFVAISWWLWLYSSGNARYAIPLFLVLGPATALLLSAALPKRYALLSCAMVALSQLVMTTNAGVMRWGSQQWTDEWLPVTAPPHLRDAPFLYLSLASQSHSELVGYVHPESSFIHLNNLQYSIPSEGPASKRLHELLSQFRYRTRIVLSRPTLPGVKVTTAGLVDQANDLLDRVSLRADSNRCEEIRVNDASGDGSWPNSRLSRPKRVILLACDAQPAMPRHTAERKAMERIFSAFERKCPGIFSPASPQIENFGGAWVRSYGKYDSLVLVAVPAKNYLAYSLSGQFQGAPIGRLDAWPDALATFECNLPFSGKRGVAALEEELNGYDRGMH